MVLSHYARNISCCSIWWQNSITQRKLRSTKIRLSRSPLSACNRDVNKDLRRHGHQEAFLAAVRAPNQLAVGLGVNSIFELFIEKQFNYMYLNGPR